MKGRVSRAHQSGWTSCLSKPPSPLSLQVTGPQRKLKAPMWQPGASRGANAGASFRCLGILLMGDGGRYDSTAAQVN